jgi:restriction system protein
MKRYYRVRLGQGGKYADEALQHGFIGVDFGVDWDMSDAFSEDFRAFNRAQIPRLLEKQPHRSKISAGLALGAIWTVGYGMKTGDVVLAPDGQGIYHVGEISGEYSYHPEGPLPHCRPVHWFQRIPRSAMSEALRRSADASNTVIDLTPYQEELESLIESPVQSPIQALDEDIQDPYAFALEKHLEEFLIRNWSRTMFGRDFVIYQEEGELVGNQFPTDTGPIDILAISKDRRTLLVIELKRGRASDVVVGQILRYLGYVQEELAEADQQVRGAIIALEDDIRLRRALAMVPYVDFYRYQLQFKLVKE